MAAKDAVREYLREIGRRGGEAKVPKGLAKLSPEERSVIARKGAAARAAARKKPKKSVTSNRVRKAR
jgi:general stress protein YciG